MANFHKKLDFSSLFSDNSIVSRMVGVYMFLDHSSEKTLDKLKVLQVVEQFAVPLTNVQLTEFILENDFVNYFSLQQCLTELVEASFLEYSDSEGEEYYLLTESGKNSIEFFKDRIPQNIRRNINDAVVAKKKSIVIDTQVSADYHKLDDTEYIVELKITENHLILADIKLTMASNKHAKRMCENWKKNAQFLYGDLVNLLNSTDDKE